jgi:hypothetical protein
VATWAKPRTGRFSHGAHWKMGFSMAMMGLMGSAHHYPYFWWFFWLVVSNSWIIFHFIYGIVRTPLTIFQDGYFLQHQAVLHWGPTPYFQNHPKIVMAAIYNIVMVNGF